MYKIIFCSLLFVSNFLHASTEREIREKRFYEKENKLFYKDHWFNRANIYQYAQELLKSLREMESFTGRKPSQKTSELIQSKQESGNLFEAGRELYFRHSDDFRPPTNYDDLIDEIKNSQNEDEIYQFARFCSDRYEKLSQILQKSATTHGSFDDKILKEELQQSYIQEKDSKYYSNSIEAFCVICAQPMLHAIKEQAPEAEFKKFIAMVKGAEQAARQLAE